MRLVSSGTTKFLKLCLEPESFSIQMGWDSHNFEMNDKPPVELPVVVSACAGTTVVVV